MTQTQKKTLGLAVASLVLGCFFWFPLAGLLSGLAALITGIVALVRINKNKACLQGEGLAIAGIVMGALSFILFPVMAMIVAIILPSMVRPRYMVNEVKTRAHLMRMHTAYTRYKEANGFYPQESMLVRAKPPYLDRTYDLQAVDGYAFRVILLGTDAYLVNASPGICGVTGRMTYSMGPDGVIDERPCGAPDSNNMP